MTKLFHQMSSWPSCFDELTLLLGNIASQSFIHNITQCVLLLHCIHLVLQCELHILHPVHLSVMEDPSPFLNTLESIRNSSPANAIRRLHHSRQSLVEGVFKISSQASGAVWEVLSARSSNSGSYIISSRSLQTIFILFYNWHQRLQTQIQIQIVLNTPFQCKEKCICHSYFSRQINQEPSS